MFDPAFSTVPSVSVVMPVYNAEAFLAVTVASVQAQRFQSWELIVVDDCSTDSSARILADLAAQDHRIRLMQTADNSGAGVARNLGMEHARGRYLAFLDADDLWHPDKLARHLAWLADRPTALSFTAYLREDMHSGCLELIGVPATVNYHQLLGTNVIGCSTVILDRTLLKELRMPALRLRQDFAFWLQILRQTGPARGMPVALTTYRQHATQVSVVKSTAARATWAMYRNHLGLSRLQASGHFARYALRGLLRHHAPGLARHLGWLQRGILPDSKEAAAFWTGGSLGKKLD